MANTLSSILKKLGLNQENGIYLANDELPDYPLRIKNSLKSIDFDAIYYLNDKPLIIFKEFYDKNNINEKIKNFHKSVWNLGETPVLFIILPQDIHIYNGFIFKKEDHTAWKKFSSTDVKLDEFSYFNLNSGNFWKKNEKVFSKHTRVQNYLLENLKTCRSMLLELGLPQEIIHNILGRLIFSRYLLDRGILKNEYFLDNYKAKFTDVIRSKTDLYNYFDYLKKKFNGELFPVNKKEFDLINEKHLNLLSHLFQGNDVGSSQTVLFDVYDFSIIPVELISNIYETFLSKESQKSNKSFFTPLFLVDYVLANRIDEKLTTGSSKCKILDPSCGSGIFLVESLRKIIETYKENLHRELTGKEIKEIVKKNIFGVDTDKDAIYISIFSIYITMMDYINKDELSSFKFPLLKGTNLFHADFFDTKHEFNKTINNIDVIVGNPPWGKYDGLHVSYFIDKGMALPNKEISIAFLERVSDFAHDNTSIALIVTSKILYNLREKKFRKQFFEKFCIEQVFEFSSVRRNVFANAIGPGSIIFYKINKREDIRQNLVKYISLKQNRFFKLFNAIVIEKNDVKYILQKHFLEDDWIWKVILYGSIYDFLLIKRLKNEFSPLKLLLDESSLIYGVGLQSNKSDNPQDASDLIDKNFIETEGLKRYYIKTEKCAKWKKHEVHRIRNIELFKPPHILMRVSLNNKDYMGMGIFSDEELIFKHSIQSIKGKEKDKPILKSLLGLLNSKFFAYYMFMTGSTIGIERPQIRSEELLNFPAAISLQVNNKVEVLQETYDLMNKNSLNSNLDLKNKILELEKEIEELIYQSYNLSNSERDLINYANNVSIPMRKGHDKPFEQVDAQDLYDYSNIFIKTFEGLLNKEENLVPEIYNTGYFIAINFKISTNICRNTKKIIHNDNLNDVINKFGYMSLNEFTKDLYILRDIKGFEKNSFYIIKPNEYKNWHKSIARTDLNEFLEAMLKKGRGL